MRFIRKKAPDVNQSRTDLVASASRPYRIALTGAALLFVALLTATILIILIANARQESLEEEVAITLTAAFASVSHTQTAVAITPTPAPLPVAGEYAFAALPDSPTYSAAATCDHQEIAGEARDASGQPLDGFGVRVWGDYLTPQWTLTGPAAQQPPGHWTLTLDGVVNRRVWAQLTLGERYLSAPVEIVFEAAGCDQNRADVIFAQIAPLEG
jgi:hypothetical protein